MELEVADISFYNTIVCCCYCCFLSVVAVYDEYIFSSNIMYNNYVVITCFVLLKLKHVIAISKSSLLFY